MLLYTVILFHLFSYYCINFIVEIIVIVSLIVFFYYLNISRINFKKNKWKEKKKEKEDLH